MSAILLFQTHHPKSFDDILKDPLDHLSCKQLPLSSFVKECAQKILLSATFWSMHHKHFLHLRVKEFYPYQNIASTPNASSDTMGFAMCKERLQPTVQIFRNHFYRRCNSFHQRRLCASRATYSDHRITKPA